MNYIEEKIAYHEMKARMYRNLLNEAKKPAFSSLDDMLRKLKDQKIATPEPVKKHTLKEIDEELDIIRGIKPVPSGYTVDKSKIKELMKQREELVNV